MHHGVGLAQVRKPDISFSVLPSNNQKDTEKDGEKPEVPAASHTLSQAVAPESVKYEIQENGLSE